MVRMQVVSNTTEQPLFKINACAGGNPLPGYFNVDIKEGPGIDGVYDLGGKFPWTDSIVDEIYINCALEHLPNVTTFMCESWRVLKNGGKLKIIVPWFNSGISPHPFHRNQFSFAWFKYWLVNSERKGIYEFDTLDAFEGFKIVKDKINYYPIISWIPCEKIKRKLCLMIGDLCSTISTELECVK